MELPRELIDHIFNFNHKYSSFESSRIYGKGYLINKHFTEQFFQNELRDCQDTFVYNYFDKGIKHHLGKILRLTINDSHNLFCCFPNCVYLKVQDSLRVYEDPLTISNFPRVQILEYLSNNYNGFWLSNFITNWKTLKTIKLTIMIKESLDFNDIIESVQELTVFFRESEPIPQLMVDKWLGCFPNCTKLSLTLGEHTERNNQLDLSLFDKLEDVYVKCSNYNLILPKQLKKLCLSIGEYTSIVYPDCVTDYCDLR